MLTLSVSLFLVGTVLFVNCFAAGGALTQQDIDSMAESLSIMYEVNINIRSKEKRDFFYYNFTLTMTNTGKATIGGSDWELYICNIHMLFPTQLPHNTQGIEVGKGFNVSHVNGCLFRLVPTAGPILWQPQGTVILNLMAENWMIAKTDVMPNWYVAAPGTESRVIKSTLAEERSFVTPFDSPAKWKRSEVDQYNPITPTERYGYYKLKTSSSSQQSQPPRVVPSPKMFEASVATDSPGIATFGSAWVLGNVGNLASLGWSKTLAFAAGWLNASNITGADKCDQQRLCINFALNHSVPSEGYSLVLNSTLHTVMVDASSDFGALMAAQTLYQLKSMRMSFSKMSMEDHPRYSYRGIMLDIARNFLGKTTIATIVDVMVLYKLNYLHLHLADDEGWRLEIDGLPELTEVGGRNCHDLSETTCILPQFGAHLSKETDRFLTKGDYLELLDYASKRGVKVIPEFDMPGHSHSAIKAMEARYRKLRATGSNESVASEYLLSDVNDTSMYISLQLYTDNAINPCLNSTYHFIEKLVRVVQGYHEAVDGQTLDFIHLGGDEVPHGAWINSSICQKEILSKPEFQSKADLKKYFVKRAYAVTSQAGLGMAMWEDGFMEEGVPYSLTDITGSATPDKSLYAYAWQNIWEWGAAERSYLLANAGYKVVLVPATHLYFDHPQEPDPDERGFYWATRFTGTNKTFGFMPDKIYANANHDLGRFGAALSEKSMCAKPSSCPALTKAGNIIGMQGAVWSETCRTPTQLHSFLFPRIFALSERAWHEAAWESMDDLSTDFAAKRDDDWALFSASLGRHQLPLMDQLGVVYHLNPPGVIENNDMFMANTEFDGQDIEYSIDNGVSWKRYDIKVGLRARTEPVLFTTSVTSGSLTRRSRAVAISSSKSDAQLHRSYGALIFMISLVAAHLTA